jgi:paraquat-inducible protein B
LSDWTGTPEGPSVELPQGKPVFSRGFPWIWVVPLLATLIVVGLAVRSLIDRGPLITIVFTDAEGLQPGETHIRHKDVDLGTVESIHLSPDMSTVIVRARMRRSVTDHLTARTRFWIVRPRVGVGGISGLSTLVSGDYIEMYPGSGSPQRSFVGLSEPPTLTPDVPGRSFTLHSDHLESLLGGSPISYRGIRVGEILGFTLDGTGKQLNIYAFVRAPYDKLIVPQTRFWNSGGLNVSVAPEGLHLRASSWQELLYGGVTFDSPEGALNRPPGAPVSVFHLYRSEEDAKRDPRDDALVYRVNFAGAEGGDVRPGTEVQLQGTEVGQVTDARLQYDDASHTLVTRVTLEIDPSRIEIVHRRPEASDDPLAALAERVARLVERGLRAHLTTANFLTGVKIVSLDVEPDAPRARVVQVDGFALLPSARSTDLSQVLAAAQSTLHHLDKATAGPELGHAMQELDRTLTHLDRITSEVEPQIQPLLESLRHTAEATQRTLAAANGVLGNGATTGTDLPRLMHELTDAARSIRELTDYLDRHPEALIRGRKADEQ